jgi:PAS domain S-box-containing protein
MFFFEKKNQKTFVSCCASLRGLATAYKSFLLLFFKKEVLALLLPAPLVAMPRLRLPQIEDTVRFRLLRLALLLLLPSLSLAGLVTWRALLADQAAVDDDLRYSVQTLGQIVDAAIGRAEVRLRLLAASDAVQHGDVASFSELAREAAQFGAHIVLSDQAGQWLVDTGGGHGVKPAKDAIPWNVPDTRPATTWAHDEAGLPVLLVTVPVMRDGQHIFNLTALLRQSALQAELPQVRMPRGWIGAIYDSSQHTVAQSSDLAHSGSQDTTLGLAAPLTSGQEVVSRGTLSDGNAMRFAAATSRRFAIPVSVVAPKGFIAQPSRLSLILTATAGTLLVILGVLSARRVASSIARPIEALAVATRQLGEAETLPVVPVGPAEANQVAHAMAAAHETLAERRAALSELNATLAARVTARTAELAAANTALEEQRTQLGLILDHMPIGVLVSVPDGQILYANPEARRLVGLGDDFAASPSPKMWRDGVEVPLAEGAPARARQGIFTERELVVVERHDGARFDLEVSAGPVHDSAGEVALSVTTLQDVSARLEAEEARRRSQRLEAVGQLTGGVAHEFNNLLMAIGGCIDLLRPIVPAGRAHTLLANAGRATDHGAQLTRQLLAFARRQNLQPEPVDLNALVTGMTDLLTSTLGRSVGVVADLTDGTWPALADATQLELVLLNLAINARDAMPTGGLLSIGTGNATVGPPHRAEEPPAGEYAVLIVTDSGTGMAPEVLAHIFEPFFTTKDVGRGTGLGLPQVLGVVQQLGGGVAVDSVPGQGTVVRVYLPRARVQPADIVGRSARKAPAPPPLPAPLKGVRLLLVDDDQEVRQVARAMLEAMGGMVTEAAGGAEALLRLRTDSDIDLVLADYTMPEMTGMDLAVQIAAVAPSVPIVLMTGYSAAALGSTTPHVRAVLQKPFRVEQLATALRQALGRSAPEQPAEIRPAGRGRA